MPHVSLSHPCRKSNPHRPARDQLSFAFREHDETPAIDPDAERWIVLDEWPAYRVSTFGRIESRLERKGRRRDRCRILGERWRALKPHLSEADGHLRIVLHREGARKEYRLDSLVLTTFGRPCPPGMKCVHDPDPDLQNCRLDNLDWAVPPDIRDQTKACEECGTSIRRGMRGASDWKAMRFCCISCGQQARRRSESRRPDEPTLRRLYEEERLSAAQIGERYGVSAHPVKCWLKTYGIKARTGGKYSLVAKGVEGPDRDTLNRLIYEEFKTYQNIADLYGVDLTAVPYWLDKLGIPRPPGWHAKRKGVALVLPDADTLRSLYAEGHSIKEICAIYGAQSKTISELLDEHGIEKRPAGFNYQNGERYRCDDGRMVRSSYEMRVTNWLVVHGVSYEYEPSLPFGTNFLSDFLANGWYMEVWGVTGNETYEKRKTRKLEGYASFALPLIQLDHWLFGKSRVGTLEKRLSKCLVPPLKA